MDVNTIDTIKTILRDRRDWKAVRDLDELQKAYEELPDLKQQIADLTKQVQKLAEPPLQYAVYLAPGPGRERDLVVGAGGTRLEVHLASDLDVRPQDLTAGQEVLLNKEQNVVAIRNEYVRGETAEVVNILKPEQAGEVVAVIEDRPYHPVGLRVKWREGEEVEIKCAETLGSVRRGDVVEIDPDRMLATTRVRPRLHVKAGGSEGTVVEISDRLFGQGVQIGDIVRLEPGLKFAFEKLPAYETGELTLEEVPDVIYDDIGGLDEQIEQLYDAIELPYLYRTQFERYQLTRPKGILLYGPPGCGKTMVAKAVANSLTQSIRDHLQNLERRIVLYQQLRENPRRPDLLTEYIALASDRRGTPTTASNSTPEAAMQELAGWLRSDNVDLERLADELQEIRSVLGKKDGVRSFFLNVKGPELLDKYVGETEHRIRKIFEEARTHATYYTPVVIFFDEMEAMFRTRGSGRSSDVETTIVPQFLSEIDGVESTDNLIVIGASNRQDMIDPAIMRPGRLDVKVKVDRPTREATRDILALYLLPTIPLNSMGVTLPASLDGVGEVVFCTAYRLPSDRQERAKIPLEILTLGEFLPAGCDLRLARSLTSAELDELARLASRTTAREALAQWKGGERLGTKLRRFKAGTEVGKIANGIRELRKRATQDLKFAKFVEEMERQEWLAEMMLLQAVALLFSPVSSMSVLT